MTVNWGTEGEGALAPPGPRSPPHPPPPRRGAHAAGRLRQGTDADVEGVAEHEVLLAAAEAGQGVGDQDLQGAGDGYAAWPVTRGTHWPTPPTPPGCGHQLPSSGHPDPSPLPKHWPGSGARPPKKATSSCHPQTPAHPLDWVMLVHPQLLALALHPQNPALSSPPPPKWAAKPYLAALPPSCQLPGVVVGHVLLLGARHGVVVLRHGHGFACRGWGGGKGGVRGIWRGPRGPHAGTYGARSCSQARRDPPAPPALPKLPAGCRSAGREGRVGEGGIPVPGRVREGRGDPSAQEGKGEGGTPVSGPPSHLEEVAAEALVALEGGSAGEIARPELVGAVRVGEEVIRLHGPAGKPGCICLSVCPSHLDAWAPPHPLPPLTRRGWPGAAPRGSRRGWSRGRGRGCRWLAGKAGEGVRWAGGGQMGEGTHRGDPRSPGR